MAAVNGFEAMKEELKDDKVFDLAALMVADIVKVLKKRRRSFNPCSGTKTNQPNLGMGFYIKIL